jgi:hypothetical protein
MSTDIIARALAGQAQNAATSSQTSAAAYAVQAGASAAAVGVYPNIYAAGLPMGVTSVAITAGGTGGTAGIYTLGVSGGPIGFAGTYTVSGGAVTAITITTPGLSTSSTVPALSFPSGGVTSATAIATVASLVANQKTYWAVSADGSKLLLYGNNAGAVASAPFGGTQAAIYLTTAVDTAAADGVVRALPLGKNLFDKARSLAFGQGYIVPSTGAFSASSGYYASDYIRVIPGSTFATLNPLTANAIGGFAFYDGGKNYISGSTTSVAAGGTFTVPANAAFMRLTIAASYLASTMVIYGATAPTAFADFAMIDTYTLRGAFEDRLNDLMAKVPNLHRADGITLGYVSTNNGAYNVTSAYFTTVYMPVIGGRSYTANLATPGGTGYCWYDTSQLYISGAQGYVAGSQIVAPVGAAYLRMSFSTAADDQFFGVTGGTAYNLMVVEGSTLPSVYQAGGYADADQAMREAEKAVLGAMPGKPLLFDKSSASIGYLLSANGAIAPGTAYGTTGFVPVRPAGLVYANRSLVPGNAGYGWNWYDRNQKRIGVSCTSVSATTTSGATNLVTTAVSGFAPGLPISGTGIPTNTYIVSGPANGAAGTYVMSAAATASGTVTVAGGGYIANVGLTVPPGAHFGRVSYSLPAAYVSQTMDEFQISNTPFGSAVGTGVSNTALTYDTVGMIGWADVENNLPWAGQGLALLGDSIMQTVDGSGEFAMGLTHLLRANGLIWGGISGRKVREVLSGGGARGNASAYTSADFTSVAVVYCNAGTNDWGLYDTPSSTWISPNQLGALGDSWVPTGVTCTSTAGSTALTVTGTSRGALAVGMPVTCPGVLPLGTTIVSGSGTAWVLSANALTSGTCYVSGGTFHADLLYTYVTSLQTWNPALRIALSTPMPRFDHGATGNPTNSSGAKLSDYAAAIKAFGQAYSIPVIDLFGTVGLNTVNQATYTLDGLHPVGAFYRLRIVPLVAKFLNLL